MSYLSFETYREWGGTLAEPKFNRGEFAARKKIDSMTSNRLEGEDPIRETVQRLVFELIERGLILLSGKNTTSESVGSVSASYKDNTGDDDKLIKEYLQGETTAEGEPLLNQTGLSFAPVLRG